MIWDDPWCLSAAMDDNGTYLPPMTVILKPYQTFVCYTIDQKDTYDTQKWLTEWKQLIGITWSQTELRRRLPCDTSWIACYYVNGTLAASCVLRLYNPHNGLWILETFKAREKHKGYGTMLLRCTMPWIYKQNGCTRFMLGYTWELNVFQLSYAWMKGWLRTAHDIQYGWVYEMTPSSPNPCTESESESESANVSITDSGLGDMVGYVCNYNKDAQIDWNWKTKKGGWKYLWMRSFEQPKSNQNEWKWTGEFIIIGILNKLCGQDIIKWITPEIAFNLV